MVTVGTLIIGLILAFFCARFYFKSRGNPIAGFLLLGVVSTMGVIFGETILNNNPIVPTLIKTWAKLTAAAGGAFSSNQLLFYLIFFSSLFLFMWGFWRVVRLVTRGGSGGVFRWHAGVYVTALLGIFIIFNMFTIIGMNNKAVGWDMSTIVERKATVMACEAVHTVTDGIASGLTQVSSACENKIHEIKAAEKQDAEDRKKAAKKQKELSAKAAKKNGNS